VFETSNGCICCGSKGEFIETLYELIGVRDRIDYVIVETTGRADPAFVQIFELDDVIKKHFYVDGIVALVDAQNILAHLSDERVVWQGTTQILNEAVEQVAVADRIIINKVDLVSSKEVEEIKDKLCSINPFAQLFTTEYSSVDVQQVLDVKAFDIERILQQDAGFLDERPYRQHNTDVVALSFEGSDAVDLEDFREWMSKFLHTHEVLRAKGVLQIVNKNEKHVFQSVRTSLNITPYSSWQKDPFPKSKLVFIGRNLEEQSITQTFPVKLSPLLHPVKDPPQIPKAQFAILFLALVFYKASDIKEYSGEHPVIAALIFIFIAFFNISVHKKCLRGSQWMNTTEDVIDI